ncbi:hypothetical protein AXW67_29520 [Bradyrhizobium neotropicale]|uniref:Uncharacterized protein n=1 Tax=Bradyrhizobium neotropicale TaxID=1497615 RepID=A0A176YL02_9BRAD|nr:hypothetical protein AXW67_29520 [Bradyrhizobium neotropicale]
MTVAIDRPEAEIALLVGEGLIELDRKGMGEIVEHVLARSDVDPDVDPLLSRDLGETALHQRLACRDDLDDSGVSNLKIALDRADQRRRLHRGQQVPEEALLRAFEADRAADLACPFSVPVSPMMLTARIAASRLLWMMLNASAYAS